MMGFILNGYALVNHCYGIDPENKEKLNFVRFDPKILPIKEEQIGIVIPSPKITEIINEKIRLFLSEDEDLQFYNFETVSEKSFYKKFITVYDEIDDNLRPLFEIAMILNSNTIFELHDFVFNYPKLKKSQTDLFSKENIKKLLPKNDDGFDIDKENAEDEDIQNENEIEKNTKKFWGNAINSIKFINRMKRKMSENRERRRLESIARSASVANSRRSLSPEPINSREPKTRSEHGQLTPGHTPGPARGFSQDPEEPNGKIRKMSVIMEGGKRTRRNKNKRNKRTRQQRKKTRKNKTLKRKKGKGKRTRRI